MTKHFLRYWISHNGDWSVLDPKDLTYSASNQYNRVSIGDVLWAVVRDQSNHHLILVGRMTIDWIGDKEGAKERVEEVKDDVYDANYYVTCDEPEPFECIDINKYAGELRFISKTNDRLNLVDGLVDPTQLQTMRQLKAESVSLLRDVWYDVDQITTASEKTFLEGQRKLRVHVQRERNKALVAEAKQDFKEKYERLFCEICGFDFTELYGELGEDYIEAHHRTALSEIEDDEVEQKVENLAMVCANCHRMLHRRKPYLSVEEPKKKINKASS